MPKNVFVLGLSEQQRGELHTVRGADELRFHGLLDYDVLVGAEHYELGALLDEARAQLAGFDGTVDAIIAHWDFPTSVLGPVLAAEHDIPAPSLRSILTCEHKYWSRLTQRESVPECVPAFAAFDPFDDDALDALDAGDVAFPFWVKPVKSHSSQLGFEIHTRAQFAEALDEIRASIRRYGDAFDEALGMVDLPERVEGVTGTACIAESIVSGVQAAPEGSMYRGDFLVHGVFDMHRAADGHSFDRLDYPASSISSALQQRMIDVTERYMRHVGFDNGCFNAEFMWDADTDKLWLIEVNTRISQSHSDLFAKVDGVSNHEFAIDVALGRRPRPHARAGKFATAAKCLMGHETDGVVEAVPSASDIERVRERFPDTLVEITVAVGDRLSELPNQNPYRYELATLYMGAQSTDALAEDFASAQQLLPFTIRESAAAR
ncbi:ATP-grasp domain-containing protein [Mycolicibacter sinensis]|uniref:ATP-grasp domain-containing protein n=1 Tax=Mycolicibacter sinensis (strain JDM601) TaxID=875328 RepID=A0A1A2NUG3_MYCSD|nr:ATP-grasp domain-containing protein [Mycolicibacter sinensis]OBH18720.1 hypothetical protein A5694_20720 [Mycolicibacter sinensis]OBI27232.1 hypothetical protein A5710_05965 [Mycolicibacter sinensis]